MAVSLFKAMFDRFALLVRSIMMKGPVYPAPKAARTGHPEKACWIGIIPSFVIVFIANHALLTWKEQK